MKNLYVIATLLLIFTNDIYSQKTLRGFSPKKQVDLVSPNLVPPQLEIISVDFEGENNSTLLKADDKGYINIKLANNGAGKAYEVKVSIKTANYQNISLPSRRNFKVINPREEVAIRFLVTAGHSLETGSTSFEIEISEKYGLSEFTHSFDVNTKAFEPPNLVLTNIKFSSEGNKVKIGVMSTLEATVENLGLGDAESVKINFLLPPEVLPGGEEYFNFNLLKAGEQHKVRFSFFPKMNYDQPEIPITYHIRESYNQFGSSNVIKVAIGATTKNTEENVSIVWINPNPDKKINRSYTNKYLNIELKAIGKENLAKSDFEIYINSQQIRINKSDEIQLSGTTFNAKIPLVEGRNSIDVRIDKYKSKTLTVYYSTRKPNLYLLAFAPNYQESNVSRTLQYTTKDADAFIKALKNQEGIIYNQVIIRKLYHNDAAASNFKANLERMTSQGILESDVFILFASSHGMKADNENEFRLQGDDYDPGAPLTSTISSSFIAGQLRKLPCKKFLFIDACYSGGIGNKDDDNKTAINQTLEALTNAQEFMVTFTSSSGSQKSYEHNNWKHGAFTKVLIEGLYGNADRNNDRKITLNELNKYLKKQVPIIVRKEFGVLQLPSMYLKDIDGELPFFVY